MKGLLIKDFFCLKKQLINYLFIIAGVVVISVLYVLSYNFGNIHDGIVKMAASGEGAEADATQIASVALLIAMLIPIACTGDLTNLIADDEKASFYKVASSLPVSLNKRVACRFITGYLFIAIGVVVDFILTVVLSSLTDIVSFGKFCSVIAAFAAVMLMYISMVILLVYLLGKGSIAYANILPLLAGVLLYAAANFDRLKACLIGTDENAFSDLVHQTADFLFHKSYILCIAAVLVSAGAYFAALRIADRKRGVA
ncbi:MAG: ABC-2 transporter permease [Clostridium sp.]|nr:ABC-2 transporter permease [Clostridium sp.]